MAILLSSGCSATAPVSNETASLQYVPGTPIQRFDTPVLVSSCGLQYSKPLGEEGQAVSYEYSVYNQTGRSLQLVALTDRFDVANFQEAFIYNLRPHEYRVVSMLRDAGPEEPAGVLLAKHRPTFFLCGSGPDQDQAGTILPYSSLHLKSLEVSQLLVPTINGEFRSPYATVSSLQVRAKSGLIPGAPIQTLAAEQESSYQPNVPPANAVPYILQGCSATADANGNLTAFSATVASQSFKVIKKVRVSFKSAETAGTIDFDARDIKPFSYNSFKWKAQSKAEMSAQNAIYCGVGPAEMADGSTVSYSSFVDQSQAAKRP